MRTKREIAKTYREQKSMGRITDALILAAREEIDRQHASYQAAWLTLSIKNVVDMAYSLQR